MTFQIRNPAGTTIGSPVIGGVPNEILYIDSSGNLAQDSDFQWDATNNKLSIGLNSYITNVSFGNGLRIISASEVDINPGPGAPVWIRDSVGFGTFVNTIDVVDSHGMAFGSGYGNLFAAPTNGMIIEGNVGIGTTSPVGALDVNGLVKGNTGQFGGLFATFQMDAFGGFDVIGPGPSFGQILTMDAGSGGNAMFTIGPGVGSGGQASFTEEGHTDILWISADNGSPMRLTFGQSADSPTGAEGALRLDVVSNGSFGGNVTPMAINGYNNATPYLLLTSWSGSGPSSPGSRNSSILFGASASGAAFIQGPAGFEMQAFGGGLGYVAAGYGYFAGISGTVPTIPFQVGDPSSNGTSMKVNDPGSLGNFQIEMGDLDGYANSTRFTLDDSASHMYLRSSGGGNTGYEVDNLTGDNADAFFFNQSNDYLGMGVTATQSFIQSSLPIYIQKPVFIGGTSTPTAKLHLTAGSTSANTAPLKFNSGSLMTSAEAGAIEFLTDKWYGTISTGPARKEITLNDVALTSGRIPFATTNGRLTDDSDLTFTTDTLTVTKIAATTFTGDVSHATKNITTDTTTGTKIGTGTTQKLGFWNATPVVQQTDGAALTNNVTVGGTTDTIADFTSLTIYATDAATIRNDIYQLARKLKIVDDALRLYGLLS